MTTIADVIDPVTFEILSHRLHQITKEMGITLERVGGTVNTTQMHDYIAALYRPDGDILCAGEAMPHHVACASFAVKHILRRFGEHDEIRPGDMFLLNDPYVAAIHQSDIYIIGPIHHGDRLVAWSATFVHVMDIGAMSPGGNSPGAREICHEGVRIAGLKLVDRGELRRDIFEAITNMTRQPEMVALDLRSEIAANNVARARVQDLCAHYGADVLDAVSREMLQFSERIYRSRLREMTDGTWHAAGTVESEGSWKIALALRKTGDTLTFDFTGTDRQAPVGINLPFHATVGVCYGALQQVLGFDIPKNHGGLAPFSVIAEPGTLVYATPPAPVSLNTTAGAVVVKYLANAAFAQMVAMSERWRSESMAQYIGSRVLRHAGVSQHGGYYISTLRSLAAEGATREHDGVSSCLNGGWMSCPNVEWVELNFPLLALYNRHVADGAGPGKFRGGAAAEMAVVVHDAPEGKVKVVAFGMAGLRNAGDGLFGGYPSPPSLLVHIEGTRAPELLAAGIVPAGTAELEGRQHLLPYCEIELQRDDVLVMTNGGGGGYGDPLERDPSAVLADVVAGLVSPVVATDVYGVVLAGAGLDHEATRQQRHRLRSVRLRGAQLSPAGVPAQGDRLRENLQIVARDGAAFTQCERCGASFGPATDDWMEASPSSLLAPSAAGPLMAVLDDGYRLKQWYCPGCAAVLETQVVANPGAGR
jgi:N-methylhydantoinase B